MIGRRLRLPVSPRQASVNIPNPAWLRREDTNGGQAGTGWLMRMMIAVPRMMGATTTPITPKVLPALAGIHSRSWRPSQNMTAAVPAAPMALIA